MEKLIQRGHLKHFVDQPSPPRERRVEKEDKLKAFEPRAQGPTKVIHVVTEGPAAGGEQSNDWKAYARTANVAQMSRKQTKTGQSINFTEKDLEGVA